jgi:hypothetical protein
MSRRLSDQLLLSDLKRRTSRLNPKAKIGAYAVDALLCEMRELELPNSGRLSDQAEIELLRDIVSSAGEATISATIKELSIPGEYEQVKEMYKWLEGLSDEAGRGATLYRGRTISGFVKHLSRIDGIGEHDHASLKTDALASDILEKIGGLAAEVKEFLSSNSIAHRGSAEEPLTNNFLRMLAIAWSGCAGQWLIGEHRPLFRRMLIAGWNDLNFPDPVDSKGKKKPTEDHFRERLTKQVFEHLTNELPAYVSTLADHFGNKRVAEIASRK